MRSIGAALAVSIAALGCARSSGSGEPAAPGALVTTIVAEPYAPPAAPAPPRAPMPEGRKTLVAEGGNGVEVYAPLHMQRGEAPLVVFLHATCMQPLDVCDFWNEGGREASFLVCPAGPSRCAGEPDWAGTPKEKATALTAALAAVDGSYGAFIDRGHGDVLAGYSRGAFAARDILYEGTERFRGLILLSAAVSPDPAKLRAAGIRRVVMATGEQDGSRTTMLRATDKLNAAGIPTKFVSLGKIGHWLPRNLEGILRDAIAWVGAPEA
jgi:predicted esterase